MGQKVGLLAGNRVSQCLLEGERPDDYSPMLISMLIYKTDNIYDDDDDNMKLLKLIARQVSSAVVHYDNVYDIL